MGWAQQPVQSPPRSALRRPLRLQQGPPPPEPALHRTPARALQEQLLLLPLGSAHTMSTSCQRCTLLEAVLSCGQKCSAVVQGTSFYDYILQGMSSLSALLLAALVFSHDTPCTARDTPESTQCGFSGTISMREEQVGRSMCSEAKEYRNRWRLCLGGCRGRWAKGRAGGSAGLWEDRWWRVGSLRLLYSVWDQVGPRRHLPTPPPSAGNVVKLCRV
jgi:hypothetical protein